MPHLVKKLLWILVASGLFSCGFIGDRGDSVYVPDHSNSWFGKGHVQNSGTYKRFLKDNHVCERYNIANFGAERCSKWTEAPDVRLLLDEGRLPTSGKLEITAFSHVGRFSSSQSYRTVVLNVGEFKPSDSNRGFAAWTLGNENSKGWNANVRIKATGDIDDRHITVEVTYRGTEMLEMDMEEGGPSRHPQSRVSAWGKVKNFFKSFFN